MEEKMKNGYAVDVAATAAYKSMYAKPCSCAYCRNFRTAFPVACPQAYEILRSFGVELEAAIEIMDYSWNQTYDKRNYYAYFSVKGTLEEDGITIYDGDAKIRLFDLDSPELIYDDTDMEPPCFIVEVTAEVPWVLDKLPLD